MKVNITKLHKEVVSQIQKVSKEAGAGSIPPEVELTLLVLCTVLEDALNAEGVVEMPTSKNVANETYPPSQTFSYIKYNEESQAVSEKAKALAESMERLIGTLGASDEAKTALVNLEQTYMWIGKAIKKRQILSEPNAEHLEARNNN